MRIHRSNHTVDVNPLVLYHINVIYNFLYHVDVAYHLVLCTWSYYCYFVEPISYLLVPMRLLLWSVAVSFLLIPSCHPTFRFHLQLPYVFALSLCRAPFPKALFPSVGYQNLSAHRICIPTCRKIIHNI